MKQIRLNAKTIPTLPNGRYRLERGVYLRVSGTTRAWVFLYQLNGKRRELGLGSAIGQTTSAVLAKASKIRAWIAEGLDPKAELAKAKNIDLQPEAPQVPTVAEFMPKALEKIKFMRQLSDRTLHNWTTSIAKMCRAFGEARVNEITCSDIANELLPVWTANHGTAQIYLTHIRGIFAEAVSEGLIEKNPADWKNGLDRILPASAVVKKGKAENHHEALLPEEARRFVRMAAESMTGYLPLILCIVLTVCRRNEIAYAKWEDYDAEAGTIRVPPERRKDRRAEDFIVPLPKQAKAIIEHLPRTSPWIFPSRTGSPSPCIGSKHIPTAIREQFPKFTIHGFRSTFSDWCAKNDKNPIVSEKCLMHAVGNQVFRAYQRDDLLDKRRQLLQEWADFLLGE